MKRIFRGVALSCSALLALPLLLMVVLQVASFAFFYVSLSQTNTDTCSRYYEGVSKGTVWTSGEWHHYVDFKVDDSSSIHELEITDAPLPASFWREYSSASIKRVAYRWPSNWVDPFPASDWKICLVSS